MQFDRAESFETSFAASAAAVTAAASAAAGIVAGLICLAAVGRPAAVTAKLRGTCAPTPLTPAGRQQSRGELVRPHLPLRLAGLPVNGT